MSDFLSVLNPAQRAAVVHDQGPLLIVAGAGTGKTTVLINRLAYLILEKKVKTEELLLLTFTEKATGELEERADKILPYGYVDLWINTFHSFGERILREHGLDIGLRPDFKLLSSTEQWMLVKKNLERFELDYFRPLGSPTKFIHELLKHFSRLKDENITPQEYWQYAEELVSDNDARLGGLKKFAGAPSKINKGKKKTADKDSELEAGDEAANLDRARIHELANAFQTYNQILLEAGYLDFGDLITYTLKLFKERPNILEQYRHQFKYVMVDEFQDTNWAQYELVKMLAAPSNNLTVVGDDDQAIYKFRGASISNILQFKDDYPTAEEIVLTANYRSRAEILDKAYSFIQHNNPNRLEAKLKIDKKLQAGRADIGAVGQAAGFFVLGNENEEASWVADKIEALHNEDADASWSDSAILVRANDSADKFINELRRRNLPYQFLSLKGLYYKPIILDCLSYLRLLDNYHESAALFRILNMDVFKVAYSDMVEINRLAQRKAWSLYETLSSIEAVSGVSVESVNNIRKLLTLISAHSELAKSAAPSQIFIRFIYDSGLLKGLDRDRDLEIFSCLNQLYKKIKEFEADNEGLRLKDLMELFNLELEAGEAGALADIKDDPDAIKIMTVHGAKGLEFKNVFIADLVDKRFPTINRGEKISIPEALVREKIETGNDFHLEEERRLFYVALTRAKDRLFLTAAKDCGGAREKKPSRFIEEAGFTIQNESAESANILERDLAALDSDKFFDKDIPESALPTKFSFSQLAAYATCPLQYKFAFILKIPQPTDKPSLIFGRVVHNTLCEFLRPLLAGAVRQVDLFGQNGKDQEAASEQLNLDRLLGLYEKYWVNDGYPSRKIREDYHKKGKESLKIFFDSLQNNSLPEVLFLEKDFTFKMGEAIIKGKIDRIDRLSDGSVEILDYKTGAPKESLAFEDRKQLILYQLVVEQLLQVKVSSLAYYYLDNGKKTSFVSKPADIEKIQAEVAEIVKSIRARHFAPKPGMLCKYCDFNGICEFRER